MKSFYRLFVFLFLLVAVYPLISYAGPPSIPGSGATSYSQIVGLFGSGSCTGFLYSDGTCTAGGTGDVLGPASSTQYKIPLWGGTNKTLVDGVAVGTEGQLLRSAGAGANPAWSAYTLALPGAAGATLYSDGTNWTRSAAPSLLALTLYGQSAGGGAQIALGSNSGSSDPNDGKILFRNATNTNAFTIQTGVSGAALSWTLPTAASGGENYLLNVDADGTMGYTDPASFLTSSNIASSISDSDTTHCPDGNSIYDALAGKQAAGSYLTASNISDTAYNESTWNGETTTAPSKNAIRDYLESFISSGSDGTYGIGLKNNTSSITTPSGYDGVFAIVNSLPYFRLGTDTAVQLATLTGTETFTNKTLTAPAVTFDEVDGHTDATNLTAANLSRTVVNSYGRAGAATLTLPAAAKGYTAIFVVGTQHNSAWKIQRAGSDTITWSSGGTDTTGKTYFQETNQAVGSRVSCITYQTGASAWSWLCGSVTGTWVTD